MQGAWVPSLVGGTEVPLAAKKIEGGMRKLSEVFIILTVVRVISMAYAYVKVNQIVQFKYILFMIFNLYLNKSGYKRIYPKSLLYR